MSTQETILSLEREALNHWADGDVMEYLKNYADDATYCDDIGAQGGLVGIEAIKSYAGNLVGQIPRHRPAVQPSRPTRRQ